MNKVDHARIWDQVVDLEFRTHVMYERLNQIVSLLEEGKREEYLDLLYTLDGDVTQASVTLRSLANNVGESIDATEREEEPTE